MATLTNPRHERFAVLVANGLSATDAYTGAGFIGKGSTQSASRLARTPAVASRIAELRKSLSDGALTTVALDRQWVLRGLRSLAEDPDQSGSTRVQAYVKVGEELGMFRTQVDDSFQWDGDLTKLTMPQLLKLAASMRQLDSAPCFELVALPQTGH